MYRDFVDSAYGQALQYRKRRDRQFEIGWHGSLQTKGTRDSVSNLSFQKSVRKMMEDMGRKGPYKGPVFLELQFHPPEKNAPSIQNLAKHYLDLLMSPLPGLSLNRKKLVLQDDSQIHFLSCSYVPPVEAPNVDLDNLARKAIIPAVHEILEPPSSSIVGLRRLKVKHPDGDDIDEFIQRLKKMPPVQVAGYDILCAERLPDDPRKGSVKLLLHAGDAMRSTLTHLRDVLDDWERDVERD